MPEAPTCSRCGAKLPADAPSGHCLACLLQLGLAAVETDPPPDARPLVEAGERIGRYKLLQEIGQGGAGVVYMAQQEEPVRRRVALKIIKLGMDTRQVVARFEAERQALALMNHSNIAKVFDAGATESGRPYFVMELVCGIKITDYCDQRKLSTGERLDLFIQVCQALQHAHQKGIIHRDLKPSNVLVTEQDGAPVPKIIDFGIAKATTGQSLTDKTVFTAFEQFLGTPAYMSPEQAGLGKLDIDTRSDIYSLGVLLYELLTGQLPFDKETLAQAALDEVCRTIRETEAPRPSSRLTSLAERDLTTVAQCRQTEPAKLLGLIRGDMDWIVMKALEKDRARRYETANGLATDIERHINGEPVVARPASPAYRFQKMVQRNKLLFTAGAAVLAALIIGLGVATLALRRAVAAEKTQAGLRQKAEVDARRAEAAVIESKRTLAASDFSQATLLIAADDDLDAVAYLSRILSADPDNEMAMTRLATLLTYQTWMTPMLVLNHSDSVHCAQFSPDGQRIVTASWDHTARVWDAQTGRPLTAPLEHGDMVESGQFSPDGSRLVTISADWSARVWDAQTGQPLTVPLKHRNEVVSAQFSPDGKCIATASYDFTARVWDAQTGQPLTEPLKHKREVASVQFSPDSKRVVTGSADYTARLWDAQSGQPLTEPLQHGNQVTFAQFSPDGKRIVTASGDWTARVWDAQNGQPLTEPLRHEGWVTFAQFSPDGKRILTSSGDNTARVWDAQSGQLLTGPLKHGSVVLSAQYSPDGERIVTAAGDNTVRIWNALTGQALTESLNLGGAVNFVQFSPDGRRIVIASGNNTAQTWDAQAGQALTESLHHEGWVTSVQFSPDNKRVVTASYDHTARVWDAQTGQPLTEPLNHGSMVLSAQFCPDGKRVVTASDDHTARVWDAQTGQPRIEPLKHGSAVLCAQFSPDGKRVVTGSDDHTARVWDAQTGQPLTEPLKHGNQVTSAQFSPDGKRIVTASRDNTARVWDAETGQELTEPLKHGRAVLSAQFSPDGKCIVTASADYTARVWNAQTGQPLTEPLKQGNVVLFAGFSPDGKSVVTASDDHTARVWDAQTGRPLTELLQHGRAVNHAQFSPDGRSVGTVSLDKTARVWDAQTGQPLTGPLKHENSVFCAQFSPDGKRMVTGSGFVARVWDVGFAKSRCPDWLLQLAEAFSGKRLNKKGILEPTGLDRIETISQLRQNLQKQPDNEDGVIWGRWLLADRSTRTISPLSSITLPQYIENEINECTTEALEEAAYLAFGNTELSRRVLEKRANFKRAADLPIEAKALAEAARWTEAEAIYREALRADRELWTNQPAKWQSSVASLVEILLREGKFDDVEQTFRDVLSPDFATHPQSAALLQGRANFFARRGRWKEAAADFSGLIEFHPTDHWLHYMLAPLLAQTSDREGYRRHCAQVLALFGGTKDPVVAERMARFCLLVPVAGIDLDTVAQLSNIGLTEGKGQAYYAGRQFVKGQVEYRQGHFGSAADWLRQALAAPGEDNLRDAQVYPVLAMALYQFKQVNNSRAALAKGAAIIETRMPTPQSGDLGESWQDWLTAQVLLNEAKALIEGAETPAK